MPPARITERHSATMEEKAVEGSRSRYERAMLSGGTLVKKSRPSFDGFVRADRSVEITWRTGVVANSDFWEEEDGWACLASDSAWIA